MTQPTTWHINASNLAEHARNPIHTDEGAQRAGFPRALVAGVTTYAYLTHPLIVAWGKDWLHNGGGEVKFRRPVLMAMPYVACQPITAKPQQLTRSLLNPISLALGLLQLKIRVRPHQCAMANHYQLSKSRSSENGGLITANALATISTSVC
jgi:hypothetical protein